jgi:CRISPR-associated exonuclease Cas4
MIAVEIVLISAIEHFSYCPRQCGLIHLEGVWDENVLTLKGRRVHERADEPQSRIEGRVRVERGLPLWSERHGLQGRADVVEFPLDGSMQPIPVEYKLGKAPAKPRHEALQLCAQALCLEEMLGVQVAHGALFYASSQKRVEVAIDHGLRERTLEVVEGIRDMLASLRMPEPANDRRCPRCSLVDACLPSAVASASRSRGRPFEPLSECELP